MPKFGTKNVLLVYFSAGILKKTIVIFEISTVELVNNKCSTNTMHFGIDPTFS